MTFDISRFLAGKTGLFDLCSTKRGAGIGLRIDVKSWAFRAGFLGAGGQTAEVTERNGGVTNLMGRGVCGYCMFEEVTIWEGFGAIAMTFCDGIWIDGGGV